MMGRARTRRRDDDGAAAVEFALLLVPLLLILFGIISYGFLLTFRQGLSQAAAEGARAAAVQVDDSKRSADAQSAVSSALQPYGVSCTSGQLRKDGQNAGTCAVSTPATCAGSSTQKCVTVTLTFNYENHPMIVSPPLVDNLLPANLTYAATVRVS